ncbi:MAG: DUF5808 domain-containing protein [Dehalococcoidales bacterium]|nr:DUF5808 domain-containing protein [Dehalococcoidales bacterium]
MGKWLIRLIGAAAVTVTLAAVLQELGKPKEERSWCGKIGFIPYDFRVPGLERLKQTIWNMNDRRLFTPAPWGVGWAVNFYALLERLRIISEYYLTEEDFLMPTASLRRILEKRRTMSQMPS